MADRTANPPPRRRRQVDASRGSPASAPARYAPESYGLTLCAETGFEAASERLRRGGRLAPLRCLRDEPCVEAPGPYRSLGRR